MVVLPVRGLEWDESLFRLREAERYLRMEDTPLVHVRTPEELRLHHSAP